MSDVAAIEQFVSKYKALKQEIAKKYDAIRNNKVAISKKLSKTSQN